jgi:hypothetical protein
VSQLAEKLNPKVPKDELLRVFYFDNCGISTPVKKKLPTSYTKYLAKEGSLGKRKSLLYCNLY